MRSFMKEFKDFINRGNVVDLAVAVVIGAAFGAVVDAFANGVLMQIVAAIFGEPSFDTLSFDLSGTPIVYGVFITALVRFLIVAFAVFMIAKAINSMQARRARGEVAADEAPPAPTEAELLAEIRDLLRSTAR